jgi:hypothetical protein
MKLLSMIQEHTPEPLKVLVAAGTFFGVSLADMKDFIQIAVGGATFIYIATKTVQLWLNKDKQKER